MDTVFWVNRKSHIRFVRASNDRGTRTLGTWQTPSASFSQALQQRSVQSNFSTVAVLPVSDDVPLSQFSHELYDSLSWIGNLFIYLVIYLLKELQYNCFSQAQPCY